MSSFHECAFSLHAFGPTRGVTLSLYTTGLCAFDVHSFMFFLPLAMEHFTTHNSHLFCRTCTHAFLLNIYLYTAVFIIKKVFTFMTLYMMELNITSAKKSLTSMDSVGSK